MTSPNSAPLRPRTERITSPVSSDTSPASKLLIGLVMGLVIAPLAMMLAWNHGIQPLIQAAGGNAGEISFWTALWLLIALRVVSRNVL